MKLLDYVRDKIAPPRFILFCVAFGVGAALLAPPFGAARGTLAAFDIASALFLVSVLPLLNNPPEQMRRHARDNDANRALLLALSFVVSLVVLLAVFSELHAKASKVTVVLVIGTLALSWLFSNTIYALHYAHLYYTREDDDDADDAAGLNFPDCKFPIYWDFIYFSFTLGMTFQTSDVEIASPRLRRVVTGHCLAAFVFNIGVLAFSINVLGGG